MVEKSYKIITKILLELMNEFASHRYKINTKINCILHTNDEHYKSENKKMIPLKNNIKIDKISRSN